MMNGLRHIELQARRPNFSTKKAGYFLRICRVVRSESTIEMDNLDTKGRLTEQNATMTKTGNVSSLKIIILSFKTQ